METITRAMFARKHLPSWQMLAGMLSGVVFMVVGVGDYVVPKLANRYLQVLSSVDVISPIKTPGGMNSFYLRPHKQRNGTPRAYNFFLVNKLQQRIPIDTFKANPDCTRNGRPMVEHKPPQEWTEHYCFMLDDPLYVQQDYSITGTAEHDVYPIPSIRLISLHVSHELPTFTPILAPNVNPYGTLPTPWDLPTQQ